jgi:hypothetical protein
MYRDDLEALRARLTTVEAALAAEKQQRAAAVAKMQAALAAADEERVKARLAGQETRVTRLPGYWRNWRTLVLLGSICGLAMAFGVFLVIADDDIEEVVIMPQATAMTQHLKESREEIAKLKKMYEIQGLELRSLAARCRRPSSASSGLGFEVAGSTDRGQAYRPSDVEMSAKAKQLLDRAQNDYIAGHHKRAVLLARQTLKEAPGHQKAIQILGAASCYLHDRVTAQWAHDRVKPGYRRLLRNICMRNDISLKN